MSCLSLTGESITKKVKQNCQVTSIRKKCAQIGKYTGFDANTHIDKEKSGSLSPLGEFGWDGAAGAYVMIDPKEKLSIFFAMHVKNWPALIGCGHAPIRDLTYEVLGIK